MIHDTPVIHNCISSLCVYTFLGCSSQRCLLVILAKIHFIASWRNSSFYTLEEYYILVVIILFGVIGLLGFSGLLFVLIYKMYTYKISLYPDSQARYKSANRDDVTVNVTAEKDATKAPPTPPPSYDNVDTKKPTTIE